MTNTHYKFLAWKFKEEKRILDETIAAIMAIDTHGDENQETEDTLP